MRDPLPRNSKGTARQMNLVTVKGQLGGSSSARFELGGSSLRHPLFLLSSTSEPLKRKLICTTVIKLSNQRQLELQS